MRQLSAAFLLLSWTTANADETASVQSRIKKIARPMYSNPPIHGARIVDTILGDKELTKYHHKIKKKMKKIKKIYIVG